MAVQRHVTYWWSCGRCSKKHQSEAAAKRCAEKPKRVLPGIMAHYRRWRAHRDGETYAAIARREGLSSSRVRESCVYYYTLRARQIMPMSAREWRLIATYGCGTRDMYALRRAMDA